jgi:hypothetical protein
LLKETPKVETMEKADYIVGAEDRLAKGIWLAAMPLPSEFPSVGSRYRRTSENTFKN